MSHKTYAWTWRGLWTALAFVAACGGGDGEQGGEGAGELALTPENYCVGFFEAFCERQIACNVALVNQATSIDSCVVEAQRLCEPELSTWLGSLNAARTRFVEESLTQCRAELGEARCKTLAAGFVPESCGDVFVGDVGQGEDCFTDVECEAGLICASAGRCPGRCEVPNALPTGFDCSIGGCPDGEFCDGAVCAPTLAEGAPCPNDDAACEGELYCGKVADDPELLCRAPLPQGEACFFRSNCQSGLSCQLVGTEANERTCEPARADGASCFDREECAAGLVCERNAGRCVVPRQEQETCFDAFDCADGLYCWFEFNPEDGVGACREDSKVGIGEGQPCNPLVDRCRLGLFCEETDVIGVGECVGLPALGEACADFARNLNEECRNGACVFVDGAPLCIEKGDAGAPCGSGDECLSTSCVEGACAAFDEVFCTVPEP